MSKLGLLNLPKIDQLKRMLKVADPDSGYVHPGYQAMGLHVDDLEAQHAIVNRQGEVQFNTGVEFPDLVYRGQVEEFTPCVPGLGRLRRLEDKLVAICRNVAFEEVIRAHPYVKYCACQYFNGRPLHINFQGVAQHYGFHTDMLDVTSNFDVATFFACCQWNDDAGCYLPVGAREAPGIIYSVEPAFYSMGLVEMAAEFSFVGWQPLPRPAQQRASAFILPANQCFASLPGVRKHYFRHDEQSAEAIWRAFDGGDVLFPEDEAAELSRLAQDLGVVTTSQLARAWQILETWEGIGFKKKRRKGAFKASGLKIVETAQLNWTRFNLPSKPEKLRDRLNSELDNVRFRMTYTPPA